MRINGFSIAIVLITGLSGWTDDVTTGPKSLQKDCIGYTIIEYGKGITCKGDTVSLEKIGGLQVLASRHKDVQHSYL